MPSILILPFLAIISLSLHGCSYGYWHKEGASYEEYHQVEYHCLQESQQQSSNASLSTSSQGYVASSKSGMHTNERLFSSCMRAHGFHWIAQDR